MLQKAMNGQSIYFKSVPLQPGMYRLNIVAKDIVGGTMNNYEMPLHVPTYDEDSIGSSSLILADQIERLPTTSVGAGPFVIRQFEGQAPRRRDVQAGREDGDLHGVLQPRQGRENSKNRRAISNIKSLTMQRRRL